MTDNDKALDKIIRASMPLDFERKETLSDDKALVERLRSIYRVKLPNYIDDAADRIEAQAAEIERLRGIVSVWLDLAIGPDEMGDYHRQKWAIKASQEALGETLHVAETCKENGETFT